MCTASTGPSEPTHYLSFLKDVMWVEAWGQPVWQLSSEHSETVPSEEEEETWYNLSMTLFAPSHQGRSGVVVLWKVLPRPHPLPISVCARFQNCPFYLGAQSLAGSLLVFWLGLCTSGLVLGLLSVLWLHHRAANVHILLNKDREHTGRLQETS